MQRIYLCRDFQTHDTVSVAYKMYAEEEEEGKEER